MKTLPQMVLPCIALYKALIASSEEDAYAFTRKIHAESVRRTMPPPQKWKQYLDFIYSHIFLRIMRTSDLWKGDQAHHNDSFDVTIHACLWHTACIPHGCAVFFATLTT